MIEITRHPRWLDVIFGQTRGWWSFEDRDLRPEHPLLESAVWKRELEAAGFAGVWTSVEADAPGEAAQTVMVATKPRVASEGAPWLILSDAGGAGDPIAERFRALGEEVVTVARTGITSLLDGLGTPPKGIVHLWCLDDGGNFDEASRAGVHTALELVRELLAREALRRTPLWFVTAGGTMTPGDREGRVFQAPVSGLGRTLLKEQPDLPLRLVDIGAAAGAEEYDALVRELTEHDADEEIALRGAKRHVRRLRRVAPADLPSRDDLSKARALPWRAEFGTRGSLGSLQIREFVRPPLKPHEVRVDIRAASLNFRDVMLTMGNIPGLEGELSFGHQHIGSDCAGIVAEVGSAVTRVAPGDAVMGMAPGALGSESTTSGELLIKKPAALSVEEAASVPTVFLTAWYALVRLARLAKGESILIHAATGGVGLAAIQIAQDVGAEIFATAGSEAKRDHLRALGIRHVMDSRSVAFADEVRTLTGGRGVDVVVNSLTGEAIERGIACLKPYGRFVEIGKMDIYSNRSLPLGRFRQNLSYFAVDLDRLCAERPEMVGEMLRELGAAFESGRFRPPPRHDFPMAELEDAFRLMAQARHIGKIVVTQDEERPPYPTVGCLDRVIRGDGTYLITGGLGGFGLEVAEHLATCAPGAIVLMGRSAPGGAAARRIDAMRAKGVRVEAVRGDVGQVEDVAAVLDRIARELPPLRGVFHGAMVLDDRPVGSLDAAALDRVMVPKARGAWLLHERTAGLPLDHFVMFSSIASLLGNPLQANYSAASAFLDELAHLRHAQGLPALTVNWGVLSGAGYVADRPELQGFLEQQGYHAFSPKQALRALDALLDREAVQAMAAVIDWRQLAAYSPRAASSPRIADLVPTEDAAGAAVVSETLTALAAADVKDRPVLIETFLAKAVGRVLGIPAAEVERDRPFDDMGLDSLLAVELMVEITGQLGFEMPVIALLDGMTVAKLAGVILPEIDLANAQKPGKKKDTGGKPAAAPAQPDAMPAAPPREPKAQAAMQTLPSPIAPPAAPTGLAETSVRWSPLQTVARAVCRAGLGATARTHVEGLENLPPDGPFILAVNHLSMADVPLALTVMPRRTIVLANERLRRSPLLHLVVGQLGEAIYVPKGGDVTGSLQKALDILAGGSIVALSPEGTRSPSGLKRAQTGVAWLALRSGLPVVPYVAWGQERWRDNLRRFERMAISVRMGAPIAPPSNESELRDYSDNVMRALAAMLPPAYRGAYGDTDASTTTTPENPREAA